MRPVIIGVGEVSNKDADRIAHPVDLMEDAARLALADAGVGLSVLDRIGAVFSTPLSVFTDDDGGAMVAERLGLPPGRRERSGYTGAGPQRLLAAATRAIQAGEVEAALVVGGVAEASIRSARASGREVVSPPTATWSQGSDTATGGLTPTPAMMKRFADQPPSAEGPAGVRSPAAIFALIESARVSNRGLDPESLRAGLGELLAPFTEVAASRPHLSWSPVVRSAAEIAGVRPDNRLVAEPYTKLMCSFPTVDLAGAVLVASDELAARLGIEADRRVHVWDIGCAAEAGAPSIRADIGRSVALETLAARTLEGLGLTSNVIARFDLYSCFPAAVQLALDAFGVALDDPRPFTLTGGLPFLGGPGASYSLHGLAAMTHAARRDPGSLAAVVGVGGACHDFALGVYSTAEPPRTPVFAEHDDLKAELRAAAVPVVAEAGTATVEAMTVEHDRGEGPIEAPVIARLPDGRRVGARAADRSVVAAVSGRSLVGHDVVVTLRDGKPLYEPA